MTRLDRYLGREFAQSGFAALVVLGLVSLGGVFTDVLQEIARGKVPATLLLSQLALRMVLWLPLILPLAVLVGLMLAIGRLYRDSEMPVLAAVGVGPAQLLRPLALFALPVVLLVAMASLWLGPEAQRIANGMVAEANRSTVVAGLEPGRFTSLANGGVAYVGDMSRDGRGLARDTRHRTEPRRKTGLLPRAQGHRGGCVPTGGLRGRRRARAAGLCAHILDQFLAVSVVSRSC